MPWTKKKFPDSMKNLSEAVRNKAIEIGNAIMKENKKMNEGLVIATATKNAKKILTKNKSRAASPVKKKAAKKKATPAQATGKKKTTGKSKVAKKNVTASAGRKTTTEKKRATKVLKTEKRVATSGKTARTSTAKKQPRIRKETKKVVSAPITEEPIPGEDKHFIPAANEEHTVTPFEAHQFEHNFQRREQVMQQQENLKAKQAMAAQKNSKRFYRNRGQR